MASFVGRLATVDVARGAGSRLGAGGAAASSVCPGFVCAAVLLWLSILLPVCLAGNTPAGQSSSLLFERPANLPPGRFPFRTYGTELGLDNLAVRRIAQDETGFLWVATEDGLYRYDGGRFGRYDFRHGLPSTWITDLLTTPEGDIWVCTPQGLARGRGERFELMTEKGNGLPAGGCNAVARDSGGTVWVARQDGLFYRSGTRFVRFETWPAKPVTALCAMPTPSTGILAGAEGEIAGIENLTLRNHRTVGGVPAEPVDSIAVDAQGIVWVQSARRLFQVDSRTGAPGVEEKRLPPVSSRGMLSVDRAGRLWVPTDEGASCRVGNGWRHFGPADGLPTDWARYIFEDREGSLWIGSLGLHRLVGRGAWSSWTRGDGLPSDTIWDIHRTRKGDLWVATDKGLCLATPNGWKVLRGTERTVVRRVHEDVLGRLWLGLVPAGVLLYDPSRASMTRFGPAEGVTGRRVMCLEEDLTGQLWAATDEGGLLRFDAKSRRFVREDVPGGTPHETFRFIMRDRLGRILATGEKGLLVRSGGQWRRFTERDGLLHDYVSYITGTARGDFWVSYFEPVGIVRIRPEGDKLELIEQIEASRGLSSERVYMLGEDRSGNLWVGTGKGVDLFLADRVVHFSKGDGLAGDDIDAMAFLVEDDGSVFIGTSSGLSLNRGGRGYSRSGAPAPVFLPGRLGGLTLDPNSPTEPVAAYRDNIFQPRFASLSFLNEQQLEYQVRLSGIDSDWRTFRTGDVTYSPISPGRYLFEVRARMGTGTWSAPSSCSFRIRPPWWDTWPARIVLALLVAGAIAGGFRWRLRRLHERTRSLEKLVASRTHALAAANEALEQLSITDPLTGLKNRRFLELSIAGDIAQARRLIGDSKGGGRRPMGARAADLVILLVDLDHFKQINDRLGHDAGDRVLRRVGSVLSAAVRESDTVVRWGGEEFLVVARGSRIDDAPVLAERIRSDVESTVFDLGTGVPERLTCSIGFGSWPFAAAAAECMDWETVVKIADRCLYASKRSGRNGWVGVRAVSPDAALTAEGLDDLPAAAAAGKVEVLTHLLSGCSLCWS
jgi:diguanylate cyclase (GGDEF)-like protein